MKTTMTIIHSTFAVFGLACFALAQQAPDSVSIRVITIFDYPGAASQTNRKRLTTEATLLGSTSTRAGCGAALLAPLMVGLAHQSLTLTIPVI